MRYYHLFLKKGPNYTCFWLQFTINWLIFVTVSWNTNFTDSEVATGFPEFKTYHVTMTTPLWDMINHQLAHICQGQPAHQFEVPSLIWQKGGCIKIYHDQNWYNKLTYLCFVWCSPTLQVVQIDFENGSEPQATAAQSQTFAAKILHLCTPQQTAEVTQPTHIVHNKQSK